MGEQNGWAFKIRSFKISSVSYVNQNQSTLVTTHQKNLNILRNILLNEGNNNPNPDPSPSKPTKVKKIKEG